MTLSDLMLSAKDWLVPRISSGSASWCGKITIIHAPPRMSQFFGCGTIGLEWFRWAEKAPCTLFGRVIWRGARR